MALFFVERIKEQFGKDKEAVVFLLFRHRASMPKEWHLLLQVCIHHVIYQTTLVNKYFLVFLSISVFESLIVFRSN